MVTAFDVVGQVPELAKLLLAAVGLHVFMQGAVVLVDRPSRDFSLGVNFTHEEGL